MIEVENLTKYYGPLKAIDHVTFQVDKGAILGFLGPNGAGKTTTMRILTCYLSATYGTARIAGYDIFEDSLEVRKRIGYLPEHPPLYMDMTVRSYLNFAAKIRGVDPRDRSKRIAFVTERCGIDDRMDMIIGKMSKGYRQRVGVAQALVHNPEVMILDEPTIGLDPKQIIGVRDLIKSLGGEHTVILSTHILPEVSMTCDHIAIINNGVIVAIDTTENLTKKVSSTDKIHIQVVGTPEEVTQTLQAVPQVQNVTREPDGDKPDVNSFVVQCEEDTDLRAELASKLVQSGFKLLEMRTMAMSLEEIFIRMVSAEGEVSNV